MFLVIANEAFGYTHRQTLDSSFVVIVSMLREHGYLINERNKMYERSDEDDLGEGEEWKYITDFKTGKPKKIKRVKNV
ncbi:MAG: hypothetical protein LBV32_03165 [Tannerellaceae bacterium]|jgi:hypothetical protein|nr:hypothetical protein [Tannerellaceae bacterium]